MTQPELGHRGKSGRTDSFAESARADSDLVKRLRSAADRVVEEPCCFEAVGPLLREAADRLNERGATFEFRVRAALRIAEIRRFAMQLREGPLQTAVGSGEPESVSSDAFAPSARQAVTA